MYRIVNGNAKHETVWEGVNPIDCIITEPPSNKGIIYGGVEEKISDSLPPDEYSWLAVCTFQHLAKLAKKNCSLWIVLPLNSPYFISAWVANVKYSGWVFQQEFVWAFEPVKKETKDTPIGHKLLLLFKREGGSLKTNKLPSTVISITGGVDKRHPNPLPVELACECLTHCPPEGVTVVDPFCGIGATGVAAVYNGLEFTGVDLSKKYVDLAQKRIKLAIDTDFDSEFDD